MLALKIGIDGCKVTLIKLVNFITFVMCFIEVILTDSTHLIHTQHTSLHLRTPHRRY